MHKDRLIELTSDIMNFASSTETGLYQIGVHAGDAEFISMETDRLISIQKAISKFASEIHEHLLNEATI